MGLHSNIKLERMVHLLITYKGNISVESWIDHAVRGRYRKGVRKRWISSDGENLPSPNDCGLSLPFTSTADQSMSHIPCKEVPSYQRRSRQNLSTIVNQKRLSGGILNYKSRIHKRALAPIRQIGLIEEQASCSKGRTITINSGTECAIMGGFHRSVEQFIPCI